MQTFKRHKKIALLAVTLAVIIIFSAFFIQNTSKPPQTSPSKASPTPTQIPTQTHSPTQIPSSNPTSSPFQSIIPYPVPYPTPVPNFALYPGEVTKYQNYSLTPIGAYIADIIQHPDVAIHGTQDVNQTTYRLIITGLVNNSLTYTYGDVVNNFQSYQQVAPLLCVEGWSVNMLWEGVRVKDLLAGAGMSPNATVLIFNASDGYTTELPLNYVVQNNILLAYKVNNVTLPDTLGFPFCLVAQSQYGYKWIKWVTEIEVSNDTSYLGYWESRGYPDNATVT